MLVPEAPDPDQGLTLTKPSPVTRCSRNRLNAAETTAPAAIADQETAEMLDSSGIITASDATVDMASLQVRRAPATRPKLETATVALGSAGAPLSIYRQYSVGRKRPTKHLRTLDHAASARWLTVPSANSVRARSVAFSSPSVASRSLTASLSPNSCAQVLSVP